jgi:PleD family two-component response regulator
MLLLAFGMIAYVKEQSTRHHRDAARVDVVTGVSNRRYFEERLERHFRRARDAGRPLALIMIDAD